MATFGIPPKALPIGPKNTIETDQFREKINKHMEQEQQSIFEDEPRHLVAIPGPFDVLLGRSKYCQEHMGNVRFRFLVAAHRKSYENASRNEKTDIATRIVQAVKDLNGRFLTDYYADYVEVPDIKAREKVAHAFRSLRKYARSGNLTSESACGSSNISRPRNLSPANRNDFRKKPKQDIDLTSVE